MVNQLLIFFSQGILIKKAKTSKYVITVTWEIIYLYTLNKYIENFNLNHLKA